MAWSGSIDVSEGGMRVPNEFVATMRLFASDSERRIILTFLKQMAGLKPKTPNYVLADHYEEKGMYDIANWIRRKR